MEGVGSGGGGWGVEGVGGAWRGGHRRWTLKTVPAYVWAGRGIKCGGCGRGVGSSVRVGEEGVHTLPHLFLGDVDGHATGRALLLEHLAHVARVPAVAVRGEVWRRVNIWEEGVKDTAGRVEAGFGPTFPPPC